MSLLFCVMVMIVLGMCLVVILCVKKLLRWLRFCLEKLILLGLVLGSGVVCVVFSVMIVVVVVIVVIVLVMVFF